MDKLMEDRARLLATMIDVSVNGDGDEPTIGFVLVLIPSEPGAQNVCVSNAAHPRQVMHTLKATLEHLENDPEFREH